MEYTKQKGGGGDRERLRSVRGKSGLRRAGRWVTPRKGNLTESATENIPPASAGKGEKAG